MAVFQLNSNSYFLCVHCFNCNDRRIYVDEKQGDERWKYIASIAEGGEYEGVEVCGVIVRGHKLNELAADLRPKNSLTHYSIRVNNEGRCFVRNLLVGDNGHGAEIPNASFNWSKYGVETTDKDLQGKEKELKELRLQVANMGEELLLCNNKSGAAQEREDIRLDLQGKEKELKELRLQVANMGEELLLCNNKSGAAQEREDIRLESWKLRVEWMGEELKLYMKRLERKSKALMEQDQVVEAKEEEARKLKSQLMDAEEELSQCRKALGRKNNVVEEQDKALEDAARELKEWKSKYELGLGRKDSEWEKISEMVKDFEARLSELESNRRRGFIQQSTPQPSDFYRLKF